VQSGRGAFSNITMNGRAVNLIGQVTKLV